MFTETYLPHANGVTTSIANARAALTSRGHEVTIFSAGPRKAGGPGVHYYGGYALTSYPDFPLAIYPSLGQPSSRRILRDQAVQVAHIHGPGPMGLRGYRAARKADLPYVYTYHTLLEPLRPYAPFGFRNVLSRIATGFQNRLARGAARFIVPSRFLQRAVHEKDPDLAARCVVVPSGIDVHRFHPDVDGSAVRQAWGFGPEDDVLLYLGRLGFEKRVDFLLDAFKQLRQERPSARLVLAGNGPGTEAFRRRAQRLDLTHDVRFTGYVPDEQVPQFYAAANAFASASDFETQGLTLVEAMATGTPSAVAAAGGYLDVARDGDNAYLFRHDSISDAVSAMTQALDAPASVRRAARKTAEACSMERCVALLETTYEDARTYHAS
jgi:1,2-diacylglycerol 3-alpha-glucosyltransferase